MREACKNATVTNNIINGTTKSGIALFGDSSVIRSENITINNAGMYGINIDRSEYNLTGGSINNVASNGIVVDAGGALTISNYVINGCGEKGINLKDNGILTATGVKIEDAGGKGIDIARNCKVILTDCEVCGCKAYGIDADENSDVSMTGCRILDNSGKGVSIRSSVNAVMTDCSVNDSGAKGVDIGTGSTVSMNNCLLSGNTGRAVDLSDNTDVTIIGCRIYKTKTDAVTVDGNNARITVSDSFIMDNNGEGLHLKNGIINISGNTIKNNCLTESDGNAVKMFGGISGSFTDNILSNPNSKNEIKIDSANLSPAIPTAKTGKVIGTTDAGGNRFE